jgi:manganese/zinc/iron transport system permease protein
MHIKKYDTILTVLMVCVLCVALRTLGAVLVIALLIMPPLTARIWSAHMPRLLIIAATFGALSCFIGTYISAHVSNIPSGGSIVLVAAAIFSTSLLLKSIVPNTKNA